MSRRSMRLVGPIPEDSPVPDDDESDSSSLGQKWQLPPSLAHQNEYPGRSRHLRTEKHAVPSHRSKRVLVEPSQVSETDKVTQLVKEASKHQKETSQVSSLPEFQRLSFTLPAGHDEERQDAPQACSQSWTARSRECGRRLLFGNSHLSNGKDRGRMFRGKKSSTSSAAAESFAEGLQADEYYLSKAKRSPKKKVGYKMEERDTENPDLSAMARTKLWKWSSRSRPVQV
eukprot:Nitzschia sp. Nitz4//scaffold24_size164493//104836//105522//NITZ4_002336-RA/size164493-processed-gene-0.112-mRNA-1//-1//CDS//3329544138//5197//frame0